MSAARVLWTLALGGVAGCWPYLPNGSVPLEPEAGTTTTTTAPTGPGTSPTDPGSTTDPDEPLPSWDSACAPGPQALGPWSRHPLSGTSLRSEPYAADAGLGAALDAARGESSGRAVDLLVSGAVVSAVGWAPSSPSGFVTFWVSDTSGTMVAFQIDVPFDPSTLRPGDVVDLRVTEVKDYFGILEITEAQVQVVDSGAAVWIADGMDGEPLLYTEHPQELVEVWGELVSAPVDCGGWECFDLDHGTDRIVPLRARPGLVDPGDCVHVIAPVDVFQSSPQLDMDHDDWVRTFSP